MSLVTSLARPFGARALRSARPGSRTRRIAHPRVTTTPRASENEPVVETKGRFKRRDPDAAPPRPGPMGSGPDANAPPSGIKVIPVEQRSRDAFQGVAKVDGDVEDATIRSLKLAAGDVLAIMTFAAIGRGNHGEGMFLGDVFGTALPFLIGWFATAPLTGTFGDDARGTKTSNAAFAAAKGWIAGVPLGLVLRSIGKGAMAPTPFIVVAMVANGVLLVGWRTWFAGAGGSGVNGGAGGNKKGNPLEFMSLLMSLTKRW